MKTTKTIRNLLMAAAVLGLSVSVASCIDNIDNNGGKTPENQQEIVQSKADKYWSVVSQLVSTDDYTPDYEGKTFEPVYGVAQEGDPTTRLVYTNDAATAAERFADIVEKEGIDENTQTYTFDDPDIGTLTYTKGDEDGAILATVDVNIKQIPSLKKIIYVPGGLSNGHFEGKAYYRFGDVVSRKTTDYDGNEATEYWVCVRPAFGPEGKEESHWVCLSVLPKKNVYHYKGSYDFDYYLPTGLGTNKEQMQNLAEMLFAMNYPESWYQNVTHYAKDGLKMFHDFSASNIKYHNYLFWKNVQKAWKKKGIYLLAMNLITDMDLDDFFDEIGQKGLLFFYKGYSWWTSTSWNCTLYTAEYTLGTEHKYRNLHHAQYSPVTRDMRHAHLDCRKALDGRITYTKFLDNDRFCWAVRHATGKELCGNGRYDVKQPLNGCEEVYRYYSDVEPMDDLSEDPEVTGDVSNAPTDGRGTYLPGDVVMDEAGNRWFCITGSPVNPDYKKITDQTAWFVSADFKGGRLDKQAFMEDLPTEEELPEVVARLFAGLINTARGVKGDPFEPGINGHRGQVMEHVKEYAKVDWMNMVVARDSVFTFTSRGSTYHSVSSSQMFCIAYDDGSRNKQAIARFCLDNTQAGTERGKCKVVREDGKEVTYNDFYFRLDKYYHTYAPDYMREPTFDEKYLGMNTWCLPWAVTTDKMYLDDLAYQNKVDRYAKDDKWVTLPLTNYGSETPKREQPRTEKQDISLWRYYGDYMAPISEQYLSMYNEPILFLRVMKVIDRGGNIPNLVSTDGRKLSIVHLQNDYNLYENQAQSQWVYAYQGMRKGIFTIDNEVFTLPIIPGMEGY